MIKTKVLILGGGLSGISASFHLGHDNCLIVEKNDYLLGHIASKSNNGFTWDEGPHVSFTQNKYVQELFEQSVDYNFFEFSAVVGNYFEGNWIDHPAQVNMYQFNKKTRKECLDSYLNEIKKENVFLPTNYAEWLQQSFGQVFSQKLAEVYTTKYWTRKAQDLSVDWVGSRIYRPSESDVVRGAKGPLNERKHYIKKFRYPKNGGFEQFGKSMTKGARVNYNRVITMIDLKKKIVSTQCGEVYHYDTLINTLPLPIFLKSCVQTKEQLKNEEQALECTKLYTFNIEVPHLKKRPEHWFYVYDQELMSTRINFTESLSKNNAPRGMSGIQVEIYSNNKEKIMINEEEYGQKILKEMVLMDLIDKEHIDKCVISSVEVPWANVIFTRKTKKALENIWSKLSYLGLKREFDDTYPMSNWEEKNKGNALGSLIMAGRFGQWKYFWSDDCVLRGKYISENINL